VPQFPPDAVWRPIESLAPGIYSAFLGNVFASLDFSDLPVFTSWWRSPSRNLDVGGDVFSQHLLALAVDVDGGDRNLLKRNFRRRGLVVDDEGTHLHLQMFPKGAIPAWVFISLGLA